jgi:DNA polymerase type B, organellar and viral
LTLKKGYTGGVTDVYKPFGRKIKGYDVNSLYPSQIAKFDMPVGKITYFEGDISKIDNKAFGFFKVNITTPDYLYAPIIQTRVKTKYEGVSGPD